MVERFQLVRTLGQGGQGRVLAVRDAARAGALVALKETPPAEAGALRREFSLLARLRHPHLAAVYDWFPRSPLAAPDAVAPPSAYTQELVGGVDLWRALRPADEPARADVFEQVLRALAHLHAAGVVHLDLKPENVLVAVGDAPRARVLDFGIAALVGERSASVRGSRSYLAPERLAGAPAAPAADLYALGVMMAEVWLGGAPATEPDAAARRRALDAGGVPDGWVPLVAALTDPDPRRRPETVFEAASLWSRARKRPVVLHTPETVAAVLQAGAPVGRDAALAELEARARQGVATRLVGPAGVGRRTVAREVVRAAQLAGRPAEVWPAVAATRSAAGLVAALERLLGAELPRLGGPDGDAGGGPTAEQAVTAVVQAVAAAEVTGPRAVLAADALSGAPRLAGALLAGLLGESRRRGALPIGLVVAADGEPESDGLALAPLGRAGVEALLDARLGPGAASPRQVAALAAASGGVPGHVSTLLGLLVARGSLRLGVSGWVLDPGAEAGLPPAGVPAVRERVALLDGPLRAVLGAAAWLRFPGGAAEVGAVLDVAEGAARDALEVLGAAGLLWDEGGGAWRVAHGSVAEALEAWQPPGGAARAHTRVLERAAPGELARAWHTGDASAALDLGEAAWRAWDLDEAERAADLALALDPDRPQALTLRARVADRLGPRDVQVRCLERLRAGLPDGPERLDAGRRLFWALTRVGDAAGAEAVGREVLELARGLADEVVRTDALVDLAIVLLQRADHDEAERLLEEAASQVDEAARPGVAARIANNLGNVHAYRHDEEAALACYERALALKEREGDPVGQRIALGNAGLMAMALGRLAEALDHLARSHAMARSLGHRRGEAWSLTALGVLGLEGGALAYAERRLRGALSVADELGDRLVACDATTTLAELALASGDPEGALSLAERGLAEAARVESGYTLAGARALLAGLVAEADPVRADELARAALDEASAAEASRAAAWCVLAGQAARRGELAEAARCAEAAVGSLARRPDARVYAEAAGVLDRVGRGRRADAVRAEGRRRLGERAAAWPEQPAADGVDDEAALDGPCRATWLGRPEVRALAGSAGDAGEDGRGGGEAMAKPAQAQGALVWADAVARGDEADLGTHLAAWLADVVAASGAERGFLVGSGGDVVAACDADGDPVAGAEGKLPGVAVEQARAEPWPWRGGDAGGRGGLWAQALGPGTPPEVLVLQNRFVAGAFDGLREVPRDPGPAMLILRILSLTRAVEAHRLRADAAEEARRAEVTRSTGEILRLRRELESTREQLGPERPYARIIFASGAMKRMLRMVDRLVDSDLPVYIRGESGTGKELVARALHEEGPRARGPFVAQNCSAVPRALFESEFFGHERGAFTGADRASEGLFRRAHRGTLFLDEIGDLPLDVQAKLLRVLETGEVRAVGGHAVHRVDARIVCATHRDLDALVAEGAFRQDLFYRLDVVRVDVPPLRDRRDDVPPLVEHFLARAPASEDGPPTLGPGVMRALVAYDWPGNVRQLENEITRAALLSDGVIGVGDLSDEVRSARPVAAGSPAGSSRDPLGRLGLARGTLRDRVDRLEKLALADALERHGHNKSATARELGLSRAGLNMKLKRLGLW